MSLNYIIDVFWGKRAKFRYLLLVACIAILTYLGSREIWTQEHRWADIVSGMFFRQDFLHPYLGENRYYDKPLLSYWLIAALAYLMDGLSTWVLRLPSALAGMLSVWSIYLLGKTLKDRQLGLLSGWMLLTTFYFIFWSRTSSADMLNVAGITLAVAWYMMRREKPGFVSYAVFFLIVALTSLCKGLVGAVIPFLAVATDMTLNKTWRKHLSWPLFLALIPALLVYLAPFVASSMVGGDAYGQNGLYLVYKENILRYFKPFDHKGPIYTYFIYLPIYSFPWILLLVPALMALRNRWQTMNANSKWIAWTLLVVFMFFTLSGSRRSYYVLPIVPFAILFTADWIASCRNDYGKRARVAAGLATFALIFNYLALDVAPHWYYSRYGNQQFATQLQKTVARIGLQQPNKVIMLDAESKLNFYLNLPPTVKNYGVHGAREHQTAVSLLKAWPVLYDLPDKAVVVTRARYVQYLQPYFTEYEKVQLDVPHFPFMKGQVENAPVAFVPKELS